MTNKQEAILNRITYLGRLEYNRRKRLGIPIDSNPTDPQSVIRKIASLIDPSETATPKQIAALHSAFDEIWKKSKPLSPDKRR